MELHGRWWNIAASRVVVVLLSATTIPVHALDEQAAADPAAAATVSNPWLGSRFLGLGPVEETTPAAPQNTEAENPNVEPSPLSGTSESSSETAVERAVEPDLPTSGHETGAGDGNRPEVPADNLKQKNKSLKFVYSVVVRAEFDDNIFIQSRDPESDFVFTLAPTIAIGWGDVREEVLRLSGDLFGVPREPQEEPNTFVFLRYTPSLTVFAEHGSQNRLNHDVLLQGQLKLAYLTLGSATAFRTLSGANIDLGRRVDRSVFSETLTGAYDYSDRTSFETQLSAIRREYEVGFSSTEFVSEDSVTYRYRARTSFSLAARFGYLQVDDSPDQLYEQFLPGARYTLSDKITAAGNVGVEFRQIQSGGTEQVNPVFQLNVNYRPFDQTQIVLKAAKLTRNSASNPGQNVDSSSVGIGFEQRFFQRYHFIIDAEYENADYTANSSAGSGVRVDDIIFLRPSVRVDLTASSSVEVGYELWHDSSAVADRNFTVNRVFTQFALLF